MLQLRPDTAKQINKYFEKKKNDNGHAPKGHLEGMLLIKPGAD